MLINELCHVDDDNARMNADAIRAHNTEDEAREGMAPRGLLPVWRRFPDEVLGEARQGGPSPPAPIANCFQHYWERRRAPPARPSSFAP